jgi:hypothetical protein
MANFLQDRILDNTDVTKAELRAWVENMDPTSDLVDSTLRVSSNQLGVANTAPRWVKYSVAYTDFPTASTTSADHTLVSLGVGSVIHAVKLVTTAAFTDGGASITDVKMDVGITSGTPTEYMSGEDVDVLDTTAASGEYSTVDFLTENAATAILARIVCVGGNCSTLTTGTADIWILWSIADSAL